MLPCILTRSDTQREDDTYVFFGGSHHSARSSVVHVLIMGTEGTKEDLPIAERILEGGRGPDRSIV
jgi:hypothetical protein